jgi:hypothetical protein
MRQHHQINYVEFPSTDLDATRRFFGTAFGWTFVDDGPDYTSFSGQGLDGGFFTAEANSDAPTGGALIVLYSHALEKSLAEVVAAGARVHRAIFDFPGGRRFHFIEPGGNELAVWSEPGGVGASG